MKFQSLFSGKNKKNISDCRLKFLPSMLSIRHIYCCFSDNKYVLLGERSYVVGRRDCDILLAGDPTVSRKHAELSVSHAEANLVRLSGTRLGN